LEEGYGIFSVNSSELDIIVLYELNTVIKRTILKAAFSLSNRQKPSLLGLCYCEKTTKFIEQIKLTNHNITLFLLERY